LALALAVIAALALGACRRSRSSGNAAPPLAPLAGSWLASLTVPRFAPAKVALPLGARRPRPLIVALHGDDDRPEWPCGSYHHVARSAFVLCPSGPARSGDRFGLGSIDATRAELRASLPRVKSRFGTHLAKGAVVLGALGPSVEHAISIALEEPAFFSRLVLIDGPYSAWSSGAAERFGKAGGVRVLFVCTSGAACEADASDHALRLKRSGIDARQVSTTRGRGLDGETTALLAREWAWLVAGDVRWK
jgi:hypothetical protein